MLNILHVFQLLADQQLAAQQKSQMQLWHHPETM
jgi:hypothetical protein